MAGTRKKVRGGGGEGGGRNEEEEENARSVTFSFRCNLAISSRYYFPLIIPLQPLPVSVPVQTLGVGTKSSWFSLSSRHLAGSCVTFFF